MRCRWSTVLAVLMVAALAGCGEEQSPEVMEPAAATVDPESLRAPGSPIADGLTVQDGTALVGTVFPLQIEWWHGEDHQVVSGWQAVLTVTGDPLQVWDSYASQLLGSDTATARQVCTVTRVQVTETPPPGTPGTHGDEPPERRLPEEPLPGENLLECAVEWNGVTMSMTYGTTTACRWGDEGRDDCGFQQMSHLYLSKVPIEPGEQQTWPGEPAAEPGELTPTIPAPNGPIHQPELDLTAGEAHLPGPGERIDRSLDHYLWSENPISRVPNGGRSLISPSLLLQCNSGLVAVLRIDGSPSEVTALFDDAFETDDPMRHTTGTDPDGRAWDLGKISTAGGYYLDVLALADRSDSSVALVTECGD